MSDLVRVEGLKKYFPARKSFFGRTLTELKAVDGVEFAIRDGETLAWWGRAAAAKRRSAA